MQHTEKPLVSSIVLIYNHKPYIRQAIESIIQQKTSVSYEIILADDCSKDGTVEILKEYKERYPEKVKLLLHEENVGTTRNLCDAFRQCRGEYITITAGDDYWISGERIENQSRWLQNNPEYIGVAHSYAIDREGAVTSAAVNKHLLNQDYTMRSFLNGHGFPGHSAMFRNFFKQSDSETYFQHIQYSRLIEDISLAMIILDHGKVRVLPTDVVMYRVRKGENNYNSIVKHMDAFKQHIEVLNQNTDFFNRKYNLRKWYSLQSTIAVLRCIKTGSFGQIKSIYALLPKEQQKICLFRFPIDFYRLIKYKLIGHF